MLTFTLSRAAGILNELEHGQGPVLSHGHLAFSGLIQDHDHDHHGVDADHGDAVFDHDTDRDSHAQPQDDRDGVVGHHHHGDVSSSVTVLASGANGLTARQSRKGIFRSERLRVSTRQSLPERPPRTSQIAA